MTPKQAIKAKCKQCIYDPLAGGTWLQQIEGCTVVSCPLWEVRPITKATRIRIHGKGEIPAAFRAKNA